MSRLVCLRKFDTTRRFGVEMEVGYEVSKTRLAAVVVEHSHRDAQISGWDTTENNNYWHIKEDSTCGVQGRAGPRGHEIVSYIGSGNADVTHISDMGGFLSRAGALVNDNCGLHVHADACDLKPEQVGRIMAYWVKAESLVGAALPLRRLYNPYCRSMAVPIDFSSARMPTGEQFYDWIKPKDLGYYENQDRRVTLNLVNYTRGEKSFGHEADRMTLEFRWPEGTLESVCIRNWIRFFLNFVETTKNRPMPSTLTPAKTVSEAMSFLGLHHTKKSFFIFDDLLHETREWFLGRIVQYGGKSHIRQAKLLLNKIRTPGK